MSAKLSGLNGIDAEKLKRLCHETPTAEVMITHLGTRERFRGQSDILRTKTTLIREEKAKIIDEDYIKFWKGLEELGIGTLTKSKPIKFNWHLSMKDVAKIVLEDYKGPYEHAKFEPAIQSRKIPMKPKQNKNNKVETSDMGANFSNKVTQDPKAHTKVYIELQGGLDVQIFMPVKITKEDIEKVKNILNKIDTA